jgi:hypothetical protein
MRAREVRDAVNANTCRIVTHGLRLPVSNFVLPRSSIRGRTDRMTISAVLKEPFSLAKGRVRDSRARDATHRRDARRFHVTFDDGVPEWRQRRQKREGWGGRIGGSR